LSERPKTKPHQRKKITKPKPNQTKTKTNPAKAKKPKEMLSVGVFKINMRQTVDTPRGDWRKIFELS